MFRVLYTSSVKYLDIRINQTLRKITTKLNGWQIILNLFFLFKYYKDFRNKIIRKKLN